MKRLLLCGALLLACVQTQRVMADADLTGAWRLEITAVTPDGHVQRSVIGMTLAAAVPITPGYYFGLVGTPDAPFISVVQDGKDVRFTISCTQESANGACDQFMPTGGHRSRTWGAGTATKNEIDLLWSDDIGLAGTARATRQ